MNHATTRSLTDMTKRKRQNTHERYLLVRQGDELQDTRNSFCGSWKYAKLMC
jgi:hypothetical protein